MVMGVVDAGRIVKANGPIHVRIWPKAMYRRCTVGLSRASRRPSDTGTALGDDVESSPTTLPVPGRELLDEPRRTGDIEPAGAYGVRPGQPSEVPLGQRLRGGGHNEVLIEARVRRQTSSDHVEDASKAGRPSVRGPGSQTAPRRGMAAVDAGEIPAAPGIEDHARIEVRRTQLEPALSPAPHRQHTPFRSLPALVNA